MAFTIYMMHLCSVSDDPKRSIPETHFCNVTSLGKGRVKDVIDIDWKQLQKALFSSRRHGVCSMISVRPSVRAVGEATVGEMVYDTLVRVLLGTHEYETVAARQRPTSKDTETTHCSNV